MKRTISIITTSFLVFLIPFAFVAGQEKKTEQRIKIIVAEDGGSDVILDTLITGNPVNDSIVLKNGKTIYLANTGSDETPGTKKYIITTDESDGSDNGNQINKEITIISSDSDIHCAKGNERKYSYTIESETKDTDSERTKYVIDRDGIVITVEGSDYARVKELTKEIEKTLDSKSEVK